jgi:hypothetical protein
MFGGITGRGKLKWVGAVFFLLWWQVPVSAVEVHVCGGKISYTDARRVGVPVLQVSNWFPSPSLLAHFSRQPRRSSQALVR